MIDTGAFAENAYFDIAVEYAKAAADDLFVALTAINRANAPATLHLVPQLWFRNEWSWAPESEKPTIALAGRSEQGALVARHPTLGTYTLYYEGDAEPLFTENETNTARLFGSPNARPYVKDGIDEAIVTAAATRSIPRRRAPRPAYTTRCNWSQASDAPYVYD